MFRVAASESPKSLRLLGLAAVVCSALTLVGCGGGNRAKDYVPERVVALGDENSALATYTLASSGGYVVKGLVYTINPVSTVSDTSAVCSDTTQTGSTLCLDANLLADPDMTTFVATSPSSTTNPLGIGYHFGTVDERINLVTMITLGSVTDGVTGPQSQAKRTIGLFYGCNASANWIQAVARSFGLGFRNDPNGCGLDYPGARTYASEGATVSQLQGQLNAAQADAPLGKGALVTVWVGQNDLYTLLTNNTYATLDAKRYQAKLLADQLAGVIKPIINSGAKVIVVGVADLGFSPYAVSQMSGATTSCDASVRSDNSAAPPCNGDMQKIVQDFNKTLKIGDKDTGLRGLQDYVNQGRDYAFVDAQQLVRSLALSASYVSDKQFCEKDLTKAYPMMTPDGVKNNSSVLYCNSSTYAGRDTADVAYASTYIWATDKLLGTTAHSNIGSVAYARASNQF
ncbi:MAG: hypothetical protein HY019_11020 [Aquabacterium sp.]|uniref:SGNH/GDSL hydrolase family protein n=1 Tax=Aquabacterium sp. TaxID=1872578 RepID=UPI0025BD0167|nr:SGNH/GDSL hydrolase family protein [Aquabacterium sp.]MBI3382526.1 hypothetical protein [Aquabacterium sp.]